MKWTRSTAISLALVAVVAAGAAVVLAPKPGSISHLPVKPLVLNPVQKTRVALYFSQNRGADVVTSPVYRELPKEIQGQPEAVLKFTTEALLKGPTPEETAKGFFSEIPPKTKVQSIQSSPKAFTVDLSPSYAEGGGANSMVQRVRQLAKTMASAPVKKPIFITVNGEPLTTLGGEGLSVTEPITQDPSVAQ